MADFKYKIDWIPDSKKLRQEETPDVEPQGIASRPAPAQDKKEDMDFYTKMYEIMSAYFDTDEEAEQVLSSKKPDADKAKKSTMEEYGKLFMYATDPQESAPVSEDPDRQFSGSGVSIEDRFPETNLSDTIADESTAPLSEVDPERRADEEFLRTGELPAAETTEGLMSPRFDTKGDTGLTTFYEDIGKKAESDHGSTPVATKDARETKEYINGKLNPNYIANEDDRSKDVGYGHKVTAAEEASGKIRGVTFKNDDGTYKELTEEDKITILNADMQAHKEAALDNGWETKLSNIGTSWNELDPSYQRALTSLAYNVGGKKAGEDWTAVLKAAKDRDVVDFARHLRRKDAGRYTAGMDNRVIKELKFAGLIDKRSEVSSVLPLATAGSGIPN